MQTYPETPLPRSPHIWTDGIVLIIDRLAIQNKRNTEQYNAMHSKLTD